MLLVGLTGSIGMGKSATAKIFAGLGVAVYDADAAVHALYAKDGAAVEPIEAAFPGAARDGAIDRELLAKAVLHTPDALKRLEAIVHPLVAEAQLRFLEAAQKKGQNLVVLDIPLLFETGGAARVDVVVVASAAPEIQRRRVLERPGMTEEKLEAILSKQTPDAEKRARADFIVDTSRGLDDAKRQVASILNALKGRQGTAWKKRNA
jgi:dephospho-CoA kinase